MPSTKKRAPSAKFAKRKALARMTSKKKAVPKKALATPTSRPPISVMRSTCGRKMSSSGKREIGIALASASGLAAGTGSFTPRRM